MMLLFILTAFLPLVIGKLCLRKEDARSAFSFLQSSVSIYPKPRLIPSNIRLWRYEAGSLLERAD